MAKSSTQYALYVSTPQIKVKSRDWGATKHTATADFTGTILGGAAANGIVNMLVIPAGCKILGGWLSWGALGASQLFVGDEWDCDRFMLRANGAVGNNGQGTNAAVSSMTGCGRFNNIAGFHYVTTCDHVIRVTNLTGTATSTGVGTATPLILEVDYTYV